MTGKSAEPPKARPNLAPSSQEVLRSAQTEATAARRAAIGTEHLLLGLMQQRNSHAAQVLVSRLPDLESVRNEAAALSKENMASVAAGEFPLTARATAVLRYAQREADLYEMEQVVPEHLLIGILREGDGTAMRVMMQLGIGDFGDLRASAAQNFPEPPALHRFSGPRGQ
jgi:ATP-dependent Clp protease ATP-binding subunit ClpC